MFPHMYIITLVLQVTVASRTVSKEVWDDVRLVGGSNVFQGRVEVKVNGTWGTVCDDDWSMFDATVVCKMLGFERAVKVFPGGTFGQGTGPILFDDLMCGSTEKNISDCVGLQDPTKTDCVHAEDAGLQCFQPQRYLIEPKCNQNQYLCKKSTMCIPKRWLCDGYNDCRDNSDEIESLCKISDNCGKMNVSQPAKRIVGGHDASPGAWPWMVSINVYFPSLQSSDHLCGGALIFDQWILTAAHCFDRYKKNLQAVLGDYVSNTVEGTEQTVAISNIIIHEDYMPGSHDHDIALVRVHHPVDTSTVFVNNVCLPRIRNAAFSSSDVCYTIGWGTTSESLFTPTLQQVQVPIIDSKICNSWYSSRLGPGMLCAGYEYGGKDACKGDSGGPLSCLRNGRWYLAGLVSWGDGCAMYHHPGIYTDTRYYLTWITDTMHNYKNTSAHAQTQALSPDSQLIG